MNFLTDLISERIGGKSFGKSTKIYKFAKIKKAKEEAKLNNPDVDLIDMGVGEPDVPADEGIVNTLSKEAGKAENRFYSDNGIPEFQEAASVYLKNVFGLEGLNPYENILHGIGSKLLLAMIPFCFINPNDVTLTTVPGYPVTSTYTKYLGGEVYPLSLEEKNNFYPDLNNIPKEILKRSKILYINYPNNPTGQIATKQFYKEVVSFAKKNNIVVLQDAAYAPLTFCGEKPLSFFSVDGAKEVGVEIHSLSKAFNMTGWRLAFAVGNSKIIKALGTIKDNTDSGQFRAIQKAGIYALNNPDITEKYCEKYSRRVNLLADALTKVGFSVNKPKATFYFYVKAPIGTENGIKFDSAEDATEYIIKEALISTVPWDDAGKYLRFSVTFEAKDEEEEKRIVDEVKNRLFKLKLVF